MTTADQPAPTPNASTPIIELVLADVSDQYVAADLRARAEVGRARYGVYLQAHNGRDALRDAYEEALDLTMYLRQMLEEATTDEARVGIRSICRGAIGTAQNLRWLISRRASRAP